VPDRPILITGFEPYGGRGCNPALEIAKALDGRQVGGRRLVGRALPVSFRRIRDAVAEILSETNPAAVVSVGLYPGESVLRLERLGVNVADFETPDNDGLCLRDAPISEAGASARFSTLPLRAIEQSLLGAGIPARLSMTAGTFLCNACLYSLLEAAERRPAPMPAGFIHVPYTPQQVAEMLAGTAREEQEPPPSMDLDRMIAGVEIAALETGRCLD